MDRKTGLIISGALILGFIILGWSINISIKNLYVTDIKSDNLKNYEFIRVNDNNIIIFDSKTGHYWRKFIDSNAGPKEWTEEIPSFVK